MEKIFIQNGKKKKIAVIVEKAKKQKGLVFVMHGLGSHKGQRHLKTVADVFKQKKFTAVRFDATNASGESDGSIKKARTTNYYNDLEDVISWAKSQDWYQEPFALTGHSLGGICVSMYAQKYPEKVSLLAPISTVVSGKLVVDQVRKSYNEHGFDEWVKVSWLREMKSRPGAIKRAAYAFIKDCIKYDLLAEVSKLTMPVLLIVGENDTATPVDHIQILYQALPEPKELCVIPGAPHTFRDKNHLVQIKKILSSWIEKYA